MVYFNMVDYLHHLYVSGGHMKRVGEIVEIRGSKMTVEFCNHESCENCHGCEGGQSTAVLEMDASGEVGDFAEVEMPTGNIIKASLLVYIFPLLGFLAGMGFFENRYSITVKGITRYYATRLLKVVLPTYIFILLRI